MVKMSYMTSRGLRYYLDGHRFCLAHPDLAGLRPPRQRTQARDMHDAAHVEWAQRLLTYNDFAFFTDSLPDLG